MNSSKESRDRKIQEKVTGDVNFPKRQNVNFYHKTKEMPLSNLQLFSSLEPTLQTSRWVLRFVGFLGSKSPLLGVPY